MRTHCSFGMKWKWPQGFDLMWTAMNDGVSASVLIWQWLESRFDRWECHLFHSRGWGKGALEQAICS